MTATLTSPELRGTEQVRDPLLQVWLGVMLPFAYATWWFGSVTGELCDYGDDTGDARLSAASARHATLGMLAGWVTVVPAVVVMMNTARRVQHAEGGERSISDVVVAVAIGQAVALGCVLAGWAILVPAALLGSAVAVMGRLQPRLNALWEASGALPVREVDEEPRAIPLVPDTFTRWWNRRSETVQENLGGGGLLALASVAVWGCLELGYFLAAEDRTGRFAGVVTAVCLVALLVGASIAIGAALRRLAAGRPDVSLDRTAVGMLLLSAITAAAWLWAVRPLFHGLLMPLYQWPLVTWIPLAVGLLFTGALAVAGRLRTGIVWRSLVTVAVWALFMLLLPGWQGHALYAATRYVPTGLPQTTQPRLLPKVAALGFASNANLHDAHLVVDPASDRLVWSAEEAYGSPRSGPSQRIVALALDSVTGTREEVAHGFDPAVSRVGPGSLQWRAYDRHWFTRVQDAVIVPGANGEAVAIAPYLRYTGFPVRHPVWAGVYVYHQDGRMEDLTPQQALARPELAGSGRLYPERLARAVAAAYGYKSGAGAVWMGRPRTRITDPPGNPQPYLTNLGDHEERWVTVAQDAHDSRMTAAVFLTDGASGVTRVWTPPRGTRLLSNAGAVAITKRLPLQWDIEPDNSGDVWLRKVVEPTPVFARGRLYYLLSIVANQDYLTTPEPVEETVVVDAVTRRIVKQYDDGDPGTSKSLMTFLGG